MSLLTSCVGPVTTHVPVSVVLKGDVSSARLRGRVGGKDETAGVVASD
jgi:hypothetical protein